jgi:hypothetical protein
MNKETFQQIEKKGLNDDVENDDKNTDNKCLDKILKETDDLLLKLEQERENDKNIEKTTKEFQELKAKLEKLKTNLQKNIKQQKNLFFDILEKSPLKNAYEYLAKNDFDALFEIKVIEEKEKAEKLKEKAGSISAIITRLANLDKEKNNNLDKTSLQKIDSLRQQLKKQLETIQLLLKEEKNNLKEIIRKKTIEYLDEEKKRVHTSLKEEEDELRKNIESIKTDPFFTKGLKLEEEQQKLKKEQLIKEVKRNVQSLEAMHNNCFNKIFELIREKLEFKEDLSAFIQLLLKEKEKKTPSKENLFIKIRGLLIKAIENREIQSSKKIMPWNCEGYFKNLIFLKKDREDQIIQKFLQSEAAKEKEGENMKKLEQRFFSVLKGNKIFGLIFGPKYIDKDKKILSPIWELLKKIDADAKAEAEAEAEEKRKRKSKRKTYDKK